MSKNKVRAKGQPTETELLSLWARMCFRSNHVAVVKVDKWDAKARPEQEPKLSSRMRFVFKTISKARIWVDSHKLLRSRYVFIPATDEAHLTDLYQTLTERLKFKAWRFSFKESRFENATKKDEVEAGSQAPEGDRVGSVYPEDLPSFGGGEQPPLDRDRGGRRRSNRKKRSDASPGERSSRGVDSKPTGRAKRGQRKPRG